LPPVSFILVGIDLRAGAAVGFLLLVRRGDLALSTNCCWVALLPLCEACHNNATPCRPKVTHGEVLGCRAYLRVFIRLLQTLGLAWELQAARVIKRPFGPFSP